MTIVLHDFSGVSFEYYPYRPVVVYGIFTYMILHEWLILMVNLGKYTIHGSYGQ